MTENSGKGSGLGIIGYDSYEFVVADVERALLSHEFPAPAGLNRM